MTRSIGYSNRVLRRAGVWTTRGFRAEQGDESYPIKLAKYVPAEVLAIVLPLVGEANNDGARWLILVLGLFATTIVVMRPAAQATWYTLALTVIAYGGWIVGTTNLGKTLVGFSEENGRIVFAFVVFCVPLVDQAITARLRAATA